MERERVGQGQGKRGGILHRRVRFQRSTFAVHRARVDEDRNRGCHDGFIVRRFSRTHRNDEARGWHRLAFAAARRSSQRAARQHHRRRGRQAKVLHRGIVWW